MSTPERTARRTLGSNPMWLALGLLAVIGASAAIAWAARGGEPRPELEIYGQIPAFQLTDQRGETVTDADLRGSVVVANFIFTRCPTVCPAFTMKMSRVAKETAGTPGIRLVSLSVDPAYDTPEVLAAYAEQHGADPARWSFLTGEHEAVKEIVERSFKISMERRGTLAGGVPDIVHGTHFVLLDPELRIRGYYDSSDIERIRALIADARHLAESAPAE